MMRPLLLLLILWSAARGSAQDAKRPMPRQSAYLELMGSGLTYSVNYEHLFYREPRFALGIRAGGGYTPPGLTWAPGCGILGVTALWALEPGEFFEIGLFRVLLFDRFSHNLLPMTSGMVGYRFQPKPKGWMVRFGFTPFFARTPGVEHKTVPMIPYAGFSCGYAF